MARFSCGECGSHKEPSNPDAHQYGICDACFDSYRMPVDRPATSTTSKRYEAGGIGCSMTVHVRSSDAETVEELSRFLPYGPDYRRGVLEALRDYSREVGRGLDAQADHWLREAKLAGGIA